MAQIKAQYEEKDLQVQMQLKYLQEEKERVFEMKAKIEQ